MTDLQLLRKGQAGHVQLRDCKAAGLRRSSQVLGARQPAALQQHFRHVGPPGGNQQCGGNAVAISVMRAKALFIPQSREQQRERGTHIAIALGGAQHNRQQRPLRQRLDTLARGAVSRLRKCCLCGRGGLCWPVGGIWALLCCCGSALLSLLLEECRLSRVTDPEAAQQPGGERCQLRPGACCVCR